MRAGPDQGLELPIRHLAHATTRRRFRDRSRSCAADAREAFYNAYLRHLGARAGEPVADRVQELIGAVSSVFATQQRLMARVIGTTSLFFGASGATKELDLENFGLLAELFRQGQATGEIDPDRDPVQLAEVVAAVMVLTITNWVTGWWGDVGPLEPRLAAAVDIVLAGCVGA